MAGRDERYRETMNVLGLASKENIIMPHLLEAKISFFIKVLQLMGTPLSIVKEQSAISKL